MMPLTIHIYITLAILAIVCSCSPGKDTKTTIKGSPENISSASPQTLNKNSLTPNATVVEILPKDPTRNSVLNLAPQGFSLEHVTIEWQVNNVPVTTSVRTQFNGADARKGDSVRARIFFQNQEIQSNIVTIGNSPPEVTNLKILPDIFKLGESLYVETTGMDVDGDEVTFLYEWTKNGKVVGNGKGIDTPVKRGDKLIIKVTPFDGEMNGRPVFLEREIKNIPPMIAENNEFTFDGTTYTYQVKATDPDGDNLVYTFEPGKSGITIDSSSGLLKWIVPEGYKGSEDVTIVANDGNGGIAKYNLKITIKPKPQQ